MEPIKTEWKIMCSSHVACPDVMKALNDLGFQNVKETPNAPTSDITASLVIDNEEKIQEKTQALFEKCRSNIQQISIN